MHWFGKCNFLPKHNMVSKRQSDMKALASGAFDWSCCFSHLSLRVLRLSLLPNALKGLTVVSFTPDHVLPLPIQVARVSAPPCPPRTRGKGPYGIQL